MPVGRVGKEDLDQVDMEETDGSDSEWQVANLDKRQPAVQYKPYHPRIENHCPGDDKTSIEFPQVIPIHQLTPVASFRVEPHRDERHRLFSALCEVREVRFGDIEEGIRNKEWNNEILSDDTFKLAVSGALVLSTVES